LAVCSGDINIVSGTLDGLPTSLTDFSLTANGQPVSGLGGLIFNNNGCQPSTATLIGTYACPDNTVLTDTLEITVYPADLTPFVLPNASTCVASVSISPVCGNYLSTQSQSFNPGESGIASILVAVNNGGGCNMDFAVDVPYDCPANQVCPMSFSASTSPSAVCSGESFMLDAFVDQGDVEISWSYLGTELPDANTLSITNLSCTPNTATLTATATCVSDPSVTFTEMVSVIVYPDNPSTFVNAGSGTCNVTVEIDPSCGNYLTAIPQSFNPGESGIANIAVEINAANACNSDFTVAVPYSCPNMPVCPTDIIPTLVSTEVCSGQIFSLAASVDQGSASFEWSYLGNVFSNPNSISLSNLSCVPVQAELTVMATCDTDNSVVISETVVITIYPDNPSTFVSAISSACTASVLIDPSCGTYLSSTSETFNPGESGTTLISVSVNPANSCNNDFTVSVPYNCPATPVCPTEVIPTIMNTSVCSGEVFALSAMVDQGSAIYEWTYLGNTVSDPNSFSISNLNCAPIQTSISVIATCDIDNTVILNETLSLLVYPDDPTVYVTTDPGGCLADVSIDPSCGDYLSSVSQSFNPGEAGNASISVMVNDPNSCNSDFSISVPYDCPIDQNCPSDFTITASETNICSDNIIFLNTDLNTNDVTIEWMIPGATEPLVTDAFSSILNNPDCQPIIYTFTANAICISDPNIIVSESVDILVYPADVSSFINSSIGGCVASVSIDPACGNFLTASEETFMPGESGTTDILISINNGGDCVSDFTVPVDYNCPSNTMCPGTVTGSANASSVCSGASIILSENVDQGMAVFTWTDASGNTINPLDVTLSNNGCAPITETFSLMAVCSDDPTITYNETVSIVVYPAEFSSFLTPVITNCTVSFSLDSSCSSSDILYVPAQVQAGTSGTISIPVSYANSPTCLNPINVNVDYAIPILNLEDIAVCSGSAGVTISGIPDTYSCSWSPTVGLSDPTICNPTVSPDQTTNYTVTFTDQNGCSFEDEFTYHVLEVEAEAGPDVSVCMGGSIQLNASGGTSYSWSGSDLSCTDCANPIASPSSTTTYTVTVTSDAGCISSDQVTITVDDMLSIDAGDDLVICSGESITLIASGASTFMWSDASGVIANSATVEVSPLTTTTYMLMGSDGYCEGMDEVTVTVMPTPIILLSDLEVCSGESLTLNLAAEISAFTLIWPGDSISLNNGDSFMPSYEGTYTLNTIVNGCSISQTFDISLTDELILGLSADQTEICSGESVSLSVSGASSYIWMPAISLDNDSAATVIATPEQTTTYTVTGFSDNCGMEQMSITIVVNEADFSNIEYDTEVTGCAGDTVRITALGSYAFTWHGGAFIDSVSSLALLIIEEDVDTVYLHAMDNGGCTDIKPIRILLDDECEEEIPMIDNFTISNAFTPNDDGTNDTWKIPFLGQTDNHTVKIFNRWGELLLLESDFSDGWDGMRSGDKVSDGTYYYVVEYDLNGESTTKTGTVTVVDGNN